MDSDRRVAFLDRDGVLNERPAAHCYVTHVTDFRWIAGAADGAAALAAHGFALVVVSNQRGVARGLVTTDTIGHIEHRIDKALAHRGARVSGYYYCFHDYADGCSCRKPQPGLLLRAAREQRIDLARSIMIGDSESDVAAGLAAGTRAVRIAPPATASAAELVVPTLRHAADLLTGVKA
jgi:D-glycero-D-manno-heptose 1,7-bisphosphate phosphatase